MVTGGESEVKKTFNMEEISCLNAAGNKSEKKKLTGKRIAEAMFLSRHVWI